MTGEMVGQPVDFRGQKSGVTMRIKNIAWGIKRRIYNFFLVQKYPWLHPMTWITNKKGEYIEKRDPKYDYSYVPIFNDYPGWWKTFGKTFCNEIQEEFSNCPDLYVIEYKEKYGRLDIYMGGANDKIVRICDKYTVISQGVCWFCGRPHTHMTNIGWILPICEECYEEQNWSPRPYEEVICDEDAHIPDLYTIHHSRNGREWDEYVDISKTVRKIEQAYDKNRRSHKRLHSLG